MTPHAPPWSHSCRVVDSADIASVRAYDPMAPIVAIVDPSSPSDAVLAQLAGADVVLINTDHDDRAELEQGAMSELADRTTLDLAMRAASTIAHRRRRVAAVSRQAGHDVAQALNVIALAAEAGQRGRIDADDAFERIRHLVEQAAPDAWRAGHAHRSSAAVLTRVEVGTFFMRNDLPAAITIAPPPHGLHMLADERRLAQAITELAENAQRANATTILVEALATPDGAWIDIVVSDDGKGLAAHHVDTIGDPFVTDNPSGRLGLGLATVAEQVAELGGQLRVEPAGDRWTTRIAFSFPRVQANTTSYPAADEAPVDQATAQANILEGVVRHAPLSESLEAIVQAIEQQLPGAVCSVLLLHDGSRLRHGAGGRLPRAYRDAIDGVEIGIGQGSCGTSAFTGQPVIASDVTTDEIWADFREIATAHGLRSCWSTPIVAAEGGETLGTFAVYKSTVWKPDDAAVRLVSRFTHLAAVAIEHHRLFGALAESEARFRSAFEGAAAGIALAARDGIVLKTNPALADIVGTSTDQLSGTNLLDLVEPSYRSRIRDAWAHLDVLVDGAGNESVEVLLATAPDRPTTWLSMHTSPIPGQSGQPPYLYVEIRDVTAARQHLADLRAREAAEAANRAKTEFLTLVSHELRTPLNSILGFAQVMQLLDLDDDQRGNAVDQIVKGGRHLRDLIDGLLDLSRIESGQLGVVAEPVDVIGIVRDTIELVRPLATRSRVTLTESASTATPTEVVADTRCVRQVLINLLDNAVKYTGAEGTVDVRIEQLNGRRIRISVCDSGPGIPNESLSAVFRPFHRLEPTSGSERDGTGLGLAVSARLMQEMDGAIGVSSTVGVGSTFWVELPARDQSAPAPADERRAATTSSRS
ncbi:MAG: ATP-binding protein [Actinomycetota bacterium]